MSKALLDHEAYLKDSLQVTVSQRALQVIITVNAEPKAMPSLADDDARLPQQAHRKHSRSADSPAQALPWHRDS